MDYMLELAGHPDVPEALSLLGKRYLAELPAVPPEPRSPRFHEALRALTKWIGDDARKRRLPDDHPNTWLAELVYQFYAEPMLAADVWSELTYCKRMRFALARITVQAQEKAASSRSALQRDTLSTIQRFLPDWPKTIADANTETATAAFALVLTEEANRGLASTLSLVVDRLPPVPAFLERLVREILDKRLEDVRPITQIVQQTARDIVVSVKSFSQDAYANKSVKKAIRTKSDEWQLAGVETQSMDVISRFNEIRRLLNDPKAVAAGAAEFELPVPFTLALDAELAQIRATRQLNGSQQAGPGPDERKLSPHRKAFSDRLLGLAFSGGGIRSATFNLGVLQALSSMGVLQRCDYLSTVSGGGYIGSWFAAWLHRLVRDDRNTAGLNEIYRRLSPFRHSDPLDSRVRPIRYLREYSNYLTPRTGFLSADTWTMVGIYTRNALLNQIILVALFATVLLFPRLVFWLLRWLEYHWSAGVPWLVAVLGAIAAGALIVNLNRLDPRSSETQADTPAGAMPPPPKEMPSILRPAYVQVVVVGCWLLAAMFDAYHFAANDQVLNPLGFWLAVTGYTALILGGGGSWRCWSNDKGKLEGWNWVWAVLSIGLISAACGGVATGLVWITLRVRAWLAVQPSGMAWHALALGTPLLLAVFSLTIVVMLGLFGDKFPDEQREWWSRLRSFMHMQSVGWLLWFLIALYIPLAYHLLPDGNWTPRGSLVAAAGWIISTYMGIRSRPAPASGTSNDAAAAPASSSVVRWASAIAPYVFLVGLVILLSLGINGIYVLNAPDNLAKGEYWQYTTTMTTGWVALCTAGSFAICYIFSRRVDINEFSMYHFYKNRLVRCYLGAARADERTANWLTGFDPRDDVRLSAFDHESTADLNKKYPGPYPILNAALNLVGGRDLAWQERKAESFVFTPKYCGYDLDAEAFIKTKDGASNATEAYVPTRRFYRDGAGPLLGMATAISGAAANPNMGRATSPASAFLMTVFNVRLGWWIGNTRNKENAKLPGPPLGLFYTLSELLGSTNDESAFVNLSDGGHFDNLGVYELIRRGCRYIIACDAGQDGRLIGEDLGELVRRCRTDFNVDIEISIDLIQNRPPTGLSRAHCVVGKIHYLNVPKRNSKGLLVNEHDRPLAEGDRPAHEVGYLVYLKPSITGDEPHDIVEYKATMGAFPHETTADQWFGESQFEAYRKLGMHVAQQTFMRYQDDDTKPIQDIGLLCERLYKFWYPPSQAIGQMSTQHTKTYSAIMDRIREIPGLSDLDHTMFDGLPPPSAQKLDLRDEFYICSALIQLMEDVYADLNLEQYWNHPHVEGWMSVFRRWAQQDAFKRTWAASSATYAERFRHFYVDRLVKPDRPLIFRDNFIVAHRGLWRPLDPNEQAARRFENTLKAFEAAADPDLDDKPDAVEFDVRKLADNALVVFHDEAIDGRNVDDLTLAEFTQATNKIGLDVLTFTDCLRALHDKKVKLVIEIKTNGSGEAILRALKATAWSPEDFVLMSFDADTLMEVRATRADVQLGLLQPKTGEENKPMDLQELLEMDLDFVAPSVDMLYKDVAGVKTLNDEMLNDVARAGIRLVPWVENDVAEVAALLRDPAVVGIITDDVAAAWTGKRNNL